MEEPGGAAVHGVARSRTRLHFHFHFSLSCVEEEMATHSSVLAWRIPETGEPGGLLSLELHRIGHDWSDLAAATPVFLCFPGGSAGKESTCNVGDLGLIPQLGRSPGEGRSYPLQYSGLGNSIDCIVRGVAKSRTWLSDFHFHPFIFHDYNYFEN